MIDVATPTWRAGTICAPSVPIMAQKAPWATAPIIRALISPAKEPE